MGKPTETLTELVVSSILCNGIDMNQSDLQWMGVVKFIALIHVSIVLTTWVEIEGK